MEDIPIEPMHQATQISCEDLNTMINIYGRKRSLCDVMNVSSKVINSYNSAPSALLLSCNHYI